jgi:hypothetical protein
MNTAFSTRLTQLRRELEASDSSDSFGLSVLLSIRRELLRLMQSVADSQVQQLPQGLQNSFTHSFGKLLAQVPFPAPGWAQQYQETEQALQVVEQVAQQVPLHLPAIPGLMRLSDQE